ncbi:transferrin-binding protein-like solute binding protein [Psychrobacter sp. FDAARGOS_221]|uniref:transferrin-binding protein-like solute binding protein n=1 Tax=Psychrobacter sp. FDAARGOS_221 TaxID=1975705 RepID=UPI000BB564F9|nr:transferrin-binding protein-like solute binding protein [Psychrobacter sp. FDAARGOS_221]PNK61227.1 hypothetical protein A6J60_010320 [Psychrobacter sp. FDAARGOS_221]
MSTIGHSVLSKSESPNSKKLNTSLKVGVVLISSVILASCGLDSSSSSYYSAPTTNPDDPEIDPGTGDEGTGDNGTGDEGTGDNGTGDEGTGDNGTGDEGTGDNGTGDEGTGDNGTGDEGTGDNGTGDEGTGDNGTGDEGTGDNGTGDEGTGDNGTGDEGTDPEGTDPVEPNEPEAAKSGVQSLNVNVAPLGKVFKTTTSDFEADENSVIARADLASESEPGAGDGLLGEVPVTISSDNDSEVAGSNGFKSYDGEAVVGALGQELPLTYSSVYKDYDDVMRTGHIDGKAVYSGMELPVDGVAVVGNATKAENVPTEGTAKYTGDATHRKLGIGNDIEFGTSEFTADFVGKKVESDLSFEKAGNISLTADIDGNKFSGTADANNGYATEGGFYGGDADYLGGVYEGNEAQGTYGAAKDVAETPEEPSEPETPIAPVNPDVAPDAEMTGFQSTALSSTKRTLPFGAGELENAIGYVAIRNDKSNWSGNQDDLVDKDGTLVPVDTENGDNFTAFNKLSLRADMVKPDTVQKQIDIALDTPKKVVVEAGKGGLNPDFVYKSVYESFDTQMQVGHVYGHINSGFVGDLSRVANVYVQGHLTAQEDIDYLKEVNDGKATYAGSATYIENIHLGDGNNDAFAPVNGSSNFDVDFVNNSVKGELAFDGDFKYMPEGNKIGIEATIDGNTFAGNVNGIDTAGGFYGEDAQFLGGIYQDASVEGGKGDVAGTGTKFQGTFGAEKQ